MSLIRRAAAVACYLVWFCLSAASITLLGASAALRRAGLALHVKAEEWQW